jgi:asparagine synthetase B (glutamine-hydrolysing)
MGDELFGGYPKYKNLYHSANKPNSWRELLQLWLERVKKGSYVLTEQPINDETLLDELEKCYSDELWNPADPTASYMALDCVAQVPDCFLARNDSYGMAYGMEGRFPLASKKFMQYCLDIKSKYKFNNSTKDMVKKTYEKILPQYIINKEKTGWTVPIGYWLIDNVDNGLTETYEQAIGVETLKTQGRSQKIGKRLLPEWQVKNWKAKYKIK